MNYSDDAFAEIAFDSLAHARHWRSVAIDELMAWFATCVDLPDQRLDGFGQPNLCVFSNHRFRLELLFWLEGTTSIHDHAFSGAFGVMHGSSLHSRYRFRVIDRICAELILGTLEPEGVEILGQGSVRRIPPGGGFVHSLYHIACPSVTIVARTHEDRRHQPQLRYYKPGLAEAGQHNPYPEKAKLAMLECSTKMGAKETISIASVLISRHDLLTAYRAAKIVLRARVSHNVSDIALAMLRDRCPRLALSLQQVLEEQDREGVLLAKRHAIVEEDQRFLLALLTNISQREPILSLVAQRWPAREPVASVMAVLRTMSTELGLPFGERSFTLIGEALRSATPEEFAVRCSDEHDSHVGVRDRVWAMLNQIPIFRPLFNRGGHSEQLL